MVGRLHYSSFVLTLDLGKFPIRYAYDGCFILRVMRFALTLDFYENNRVDCGLSGLCSGVGVHRLFLVANLVGADWVSIFVTITVVRQLMLRTYWVSKRFVCM